MDNKQLEEITKNAQRVQEQLERSGALKAIEVMNNDPSIKWVIKEAQNFKRSGMPETINEYSKMYQELENNGTLRVMSEQYKILQESGILEEFEKLLESIGTKTIVSLTNISLPITDYVHQELSRVGETIYLQCRHNLNELFENTNVFESINQLRQKIPAYFLYEHQDSNFYTEEVYKPLFQESKEWKLEISDDTFAVSFKKEELAIQGDETKDVVAIKQLFPDLTENQILNFINHLRKYPFFSLENETGKSIFNSLKEKATEYCFSLKAGTFLYRAREIRDNNRYSTDESMLEPDTGIPNIGRFNPYGVPTLYLSDDPETAKLELEAEDFQIAQIVVRKEINIIDLEKSGGLLYRHCNKPLNTKEYNPAEYVLPNFLAQCASYLKNECDINLDGFKYESTKNKGKYCYALFDIHKPLINVSEICYELSSENP